ncbi:unnamed protein product [Prorocentrum cordatum]|uniref:Uncharacterized protein n=1 Tax=Prorocentrum cordatum TaxID=2364126 RepID=A0ABN9TRD4_9DINO|nr:unnamed protein product [Polarella glacialis]
MRVTRSVSSPSCRRRRSGRLAQGRALHVFAWPRRRHQSSAPLDTRSTAPPFGPFAPIFRLWRWAPVLGPPAAPRGRDWVLAAGEGGGLHDVTRRYAARWTATLAARGSLGRRFEALVAALAEPGAAGELDSQAVRLARADLLDEESLARRAQREPVPTSRAGFKRHCGYVLESQLRQNEVVHPAGARPAGLFRGQERIWRRADVQELRSPAQWRRQGRCVRQGERAVKTLRGGSAFQMPLYGAWQTEPAPEEAPSAPAAQDQLGPIPGVNNYGNLELIGPGAAQALPPGVVHVPDDGPVVRSVAARLGVEFAPAVVGFAHERGGAVKPRFGGVVVWQRDAPAVAEAAAAERDRLEAAKEQKTAERLESAWRLLVKNVLVDLYVEGRYASAG